MSTKSVRWVSTKMTRTLKWNKTTLPTASLDRILHITPANSLHSVCCTRPIELPSCLPHAFFQTSGGWSSRSGWSALLKFVQCLSLATSTKYWLQRAQIEDHVTDAWFNVFTVLFEVTSAYGTVGLSLGSPEVMFLFPPRAGMWLMLLRP